MATAKKKRQITTRGEKCYHQNEAVKNWKYLIICNTVIKY